MRKLRPEVQRVDPADGTDRYLGVILDFIAAGINNNELHEQIRLELSEQRSADEVGRQLLQVIHVNQLPSSVDILDWHSNYLDYGRESFSIQGMHSAMANAGRNVTLDILGALRCASEDCSAFIRWISNPEAYLDYEPRLPIDLGRILQRPFLQLCTFKETNVRLLESEQGVTARWAMSQILASHDKHVVISEGAILTGSPALSIACERFGISRFELLRRRMVAARRRFAANRE